MVATVRELLHYSDEKKKVVSILARVMATHTAGERLTIKQRPSLEHIRKAN